MRINIYYGGRGIIEDPTLYVINKMTEVLKELRVEVMRYNLYEDKYGITTLPSTLKEADGVVLATTVEWLGIGGLMQQFLDACWLYSDKEKISNLYMLPVVMASTYGERDGECTLLKAWEMLGGIPCDGLCAYVADHVMFETNSEYAKIIEKKTEFFYRNLSQKVKNLPSSNIAVKNNILRTTALNLTPQESEQLSMYVSDDTYVKKQKEDIKELTDMFKELLGNEEEEKDQEFVSNFKQNFKPLDGFSASYLIKLSDTGRSIVIEIDGKSMKCYYGQKDNATVITSTSRQVLRDIVAGKKTFQGTFMSGELKAKGNFNVLRSFDTVFRFDIIG